MYRDGANRLLARELFALAEEALGRPPDVRIGTCCAWRRPRPALSAFATKPTPARTRKRGAAHSLAAHHLFYDGNSAPRTAAVVKFLRANG